MTNFLEYNKQNIAYARDNRKLPTPEEWKLWHLFVKNRPLWYKFTRQKPIWNYILDIYCSKLMLWIEIDWWYHDYIYEYDNKRSEILSTLWIKIIRYSNNDINYNIHGVVDDITNKIKDREIELGLI